MAASGYCDVYVYIDDFSATSGEVNHYAEFVLASVPQKDSSNQVLSDVRVIVPAESNYISLEIKHNTFVRVKIPTTGFVKSFIVSEEDALNLADLIEAEDATGTIVITPSDHGLLTGLSDDDHSQYHNDTRGDIRYYQKSETYTQAEVEALIPVIPKKWVAFIDIDFDGSDTVTVKYNTFSETITVNNVAGSGVSIEKTTAFGNSTSNCIVTTGTPYPDIPITTRVRTDSGMWDIALMAADGVTGLNSVSIHVTVEDYT